MSHADIVKYCAKACSDILVEEETFFIIKLVLCNVFNVNILVVQKYV